MASNRDSLKPGPRTKPTEPHWGPGWPALSEHRPLARRPHLPSAPPASPRCPGTPVGEKTVARGELKPPPSLSPEHLNFWKRFSFLFKAQREKLLERLKISVKGEEEKENDPAFPSFRAKGSEPTQALVTPSSGGVTASSVNAGPEGPLLSTVPSVP